MPAAETAATLKLARELIARRSITPEDGGCQELLAARLARLGFATEPVRSGEGANLWARRGDARPLLCFVAKHPSHKGSVALLITSDEEGPAVNGTAKVGELLKS